MEFEVFFRYAVARVTIKDRREADGASSERRNSGTKGLGFRRDLRRKAEAGPHAAVPTSFTISRNQRLRAWSVHRRLLD